MADKHTRHRMSAADAAWLHMDRPENPMVVNGLLRLGSVPELDAVREALETRMLAPYPRFRQLAVDPLGQTPSFEEDPSFQIGNHLHRLALPAPGGPDALEEMIADLITPQLDLGRPLWHAYLIEVGDGTAALLWRIHHCIADGIALGQVMLSTADGEPMPCPDPDPNSRQRGLAGRLAAASLQVAGTVGAAARAVTRETLATAAHPGHLEEIGASALRDAATAAKLIGSPPDPESNLRRPLSGSRRAAWSQPFPLQSLKDSCHRRRVKLNDMLLAALAGTLAENVDWEERPDRIHAMVPVNLRPLDRPLPRELGNDFALVLLELPLADLAPAERLRRVNVSMNAIKGSIEAPLSFGFLSGMGSVPRPVEDRLVRFFTAKASMVVTDVPGPCERLSFAGAPVDGVLVWAPCSGTIGMTVSIFSYAGDVTIGFMADTALVPDPRPLARGFEHELDRLR